jgi:hypothetical protein
MKVTWIINQRPINGEFRFQARELSRSTGASVRYRVALPALGLEKSAHEVEILSPLDSNGSNEVDKFDGNVAIFSKLSENEPEAYLRQAEKWLTLAHALKTRGVRIITDVCDNHFEDAQDEKLHIFGDVRKIYLQEIISRSDAVVASTPAMAELITQYTGETAYVIGDPVEGPRNEAAFTCPGKDGYLKLLWFGHPTNLATLNVLISGLVDLSRTVPVDMHIVTNPDGSNIEDIFRQLSQQYGPAFQTQISRWSLQQTWHALQDCHLVLIPGAQTGVQRVKSPNRLLESLWAGRMAVTDAIPSYQEFSDYCWTRGNIIHGIEWALANPGEVISHIQSGQKYIELHYTAEAVSRSWDKVLTSLE